MAYDLLGKNFTPPDVHAKVTGKAKYSEDFRVDGMVFVKLLTSPMPHARVTNIDASEALAMPGVHGVLTADEVPSFPDPQETILTNEPVFVGQPILAVAADSEELASDAFERIKVTYEELPFTVDPLQSLFPGGPNARTNGNVANPGVELRTIKWTAQDFAAATDGQLPTGEAVTEWSFGDVDAGLAAAKLVLDETFVTAGLGHHSMEPRSALAYWQNGKCFLYGSTQGQSFRSPALRVLSASSPRTSSTSRSFVAAASARRAEPIR
jgi:xanthine dehydrogenase molybdenum-binding subunit